jgi:hypothetical protein
VANFPIEFDGKAAAGRAVTQPDAKPVEVPIPKFTVEPPVPAPTGVPAPTRAAAAAGQQTHRFILATLNGWPEVKTEWELQCHTFFGHKICINLPVFYRRTCHVVVYVDVHYPSVAGALQDITQCVIGAALAAAIAAILLHGAGAAPAFQAALIACLIAKGKTWAHEISANAGATSECGGWTRI